MLIVETFDKMLLTNERCVFMGELKHRKQKTFSVNLKLLKKFMELSDSTRIPQSRLLDEAIEDLLKKYGYSQT